GPSPRISRDPTDAFGAEWARPAEARECSERPPMLSSRPPGEDNAMVDKVEKIWMNGELVPWDSANIHVLTHTLHYGLGVFEGIRCYKLDDGRSAIFRLEDHIRRMYDSAKIMRLDMPFDAATVVEACAETVRANGLDECYIRPIAFMGSGAMGVGARPPTTISVIAWRWGAY